ncbi:hypothetical protein DFH94DRAFT_691497 [Russula ochroleuca]|uniref:C2H2-type domain-containing protein n=1 Tax=Russula ochroleuca TaxID=152965 RepID=A0A9P5TAR6_9AGAM|nr:hypothetical protein DFH94DRAFT_691497 [Russula ochroleuca]
MSSVQIRCHGCNRNFTPRGLSQHVNRTPHPPCRAVYITSQLPSVSTSVPRTVFPPALDPSCTSCDLGDDTPGDEYGAANDRAPNPAVGVHSLDDDVVLSFRGGSNDMFNPANVTDVDVFEALEYSNNISMATIPDHLTVDENLGDLEEESVQIDAENSDTTSTVVIEQFPSGSPGTPIPDTPRGSPAYASHQDMLADSVWAPFHSQHDWAIVCWAKMSGPTSTAVTELLAIPEVVDTLSLSYRTTKQLNDIIDKEMSGRPPFQCKVLNIGDERLEFYSRDALECIRSLYGDPEFTQDLVFAPERHYTSHECTSCLYNEMYTCDWWWTVQTILESRQPGATVILLIVSSDKTQLMLFRGKTAYLIYMTIGNIPKDIRQKPSRQAQLLIGYIPTTKLEGVTNKATRRWVTMMSGNGIWHRCHPIFAIFVGDYPKQALITCTYNGRCPKCCITPGQLGEYQTFLCLVQNTALNTYLLANGNIPAFQQACREAGLKPVYHPFWESLPLADIFLSITPDILHQMLQGIMKHLIKWLVCVFGPREINAQCRAMLPSPRPWDFPPLIDGDISREDSPMELDEPEGAVSLD